MQYNVNATSADPESPTYAGVWVTMEVIGLEHPSAPSTNDAVVLAVRDFLEALAGTTVTQVRKTYPVSEDLPLS